MPRPRRRIDLACGDLRLQGGERLRAIEDRRPERPGPARVPRLEGRGQRLALQEVGGDQQRTGQGVDPADVGEEQVGAVGALAPELRVEVEAAGGESAAPQDLVDRECQVLDRVRELVGVPAVLRVAAVRVDAAQDAVATAYATSWWNE